MLNKYFYLNTIGCQMNVYDSEQIAARLVALGYQQTGILEIADLVIVNTCTIRAKAEQKAFSFLGRLARLKIKKPGLIIGVGGCVAQQEGDKILRRVPHIDLVFGTQAIDRLPLLIPKIEDKRCRIVDVALTEKSNPPGPCPTADSMARCRLLPPLCVDATIIVHIAWYPTCAEGRPAGIRTASWKKSGVLFNPV